jgi:hypothetical protein
VPAPKNKRHQCTGLIEASLDPWLLFLLKITDVNNASEVTGVPRKLVEQTFQIVTEPEQTELVIKAFENSVSDYPLTIRDKKGS